MNGEIQGVRRTHGQPMGEPRRTVSGYIKICGAPSGGTTENPFGDHTNEPIFFSLPDVNHEMEWGRQGSEGNPELSFFFFFFFFF